MPIHPITRLDRIVLVLPGGFCGIVVGGFDGFQVLVTFSEGSDDAGVYEVLAEDLPEADLKDAAQVCKGFSGSFPEGVGLDKYLDAVIFYGFQDAFGFSVADVPPQGPLRDFLETSCEKACQPLHVTFISTPFTSALTSGL